ncbi:hypothetical protein F4778DRAFT_390605 [Xylariomycetidae sp. FL2044]|nr:hypothetical protein F4778DRAFT_390605 [Xylariomycetidae sp. FL2044]
MTSNAHRPPCYSDQHHHYHQVPFPSSHPYTKQYSSLHRHTIHFVLHHCISYPIIIIIINLAFSPFGTGSPPYPKQTSSKFTTTRCALTSSINPISFRQSDIQPLFLSFLGPGIGFLDLELLVGLID